jgi:hypothetical protein
VRSWDQSSPSRSTYDCPITVHLSEETSQSVSSSQIWARDTYSLRWTGHSSSYHVKCDRTSVALETATISGIQVAMATQAEGPACTAAVSTRPALHRVGDPPLLETLSPQSRLPVGSEVSPGRSLGCLIMVNSCLIPHHQPVHSQATKLRLVRSCTHTRFRKMCRLSTPQCRLFTNRVRRSSSLLLALNRPRRYTKHELLR